MSTPLWSLVFTVSKGVVIAEITLPPIKAGITFAYRTFFSFLWLRYYLPITIFLICSTLSQYKQEYIASLAKVILKLALDSVILLDSVEFINLTRNAYIGLSAKVTISLVIRAADIVAKLEGIT